MDLNLESRVNLVLTPSLKIRLCYPIRHTHPEILARQGGGGKATLGTQVATVGRPGGLCDGGLVV